MIATQHRHSAIFLRAVTLGALTLSVVLLLSACQGEKPKVGTTLSTATSSTTVPLSPLQAEALATGDLLIDNVLSAIMQLTAAPDPTSPRIASEFTGQAADQVRALLQNLVDQGLRLEGTLQSQTSASRVTSVTDTSGVLSGFRYIACIDDQQFPVVSATQEVRAGSPLDSAYEIDFVRSADTWIVERLLINGPGLRCLAPNQPPAGDPS